MRRLRELLTVHWNLKLTAILLAVMLWLAVHGEQSGERTIPVTLEIHNVPRNMMITNSRPTSVDVTVRGQLTNFAGWGPAPTCVIDLQSADEGERVFPLSAENVRLARGPGLEILAVYPPRVRLVLERTVSKEVPIRPVLDGDVAPGYELYVATHNPTSVLLTGPRSHLEQVREAPTEAIALDGQRETIRSFVHLNIRDTMVQSSQVRPVEVVVEIGERRHVRRVTDVPVVADQGNLVATPPRVAVELLVPPGFNGTLEPASFQAVVSARTLGPSVTQGRVRPEIRATAPLGPGVAIRSSIPASVTVRRSGSAR